ncbi:hypothetical protein OsJ_24255 [Oryza sativa Japonica Group]|uniref:Uncharacterized protein n=1 Tax=Oryza sativa subsp. japonica TaxID=39947 RepID=B9FX82_ORYSJ|nr:hypothetical protein OsJ_24255 [Oryza sativa Japonica Group]
MAWMTRGYKASEYAIRGELMAWRLYEQSKVMELIDAKMQANGFDEKRQVMQIPARWGMRVAAFSDITAAEEEREEKRAFLTVREMMEKEERNG